MTSTKTLVSAAVPAAGTYATDWIEFLGGLDYVALQTVFVRTGGGTTLKVYLQTSLDGGTTPIDVACQAFATMTATKVSALSAVIAPAAQAGAPTDATHSDNTVLNGGQSGASVRVSGIRGTIAANRVLASATNGVVLGAMAAGSKLVENDIRDNPGDGVRILPGAEVVRFLSSTLWR